jgi:hypothetical protein
MTTRPCIHGDAWPSGHGTMYKSIQLSRRHLSVRGLLRVDETIVSPGSPLLSCILLYLGDAWPSGHGTMYNSIELTHSPWRDEHVR